MIPIFRYSDSGIVCSTGIIDRVPLTQRPRHAPVFAIWVLIRKFTLPA